ncbi:MAG TPA: hypothetical protein VGE01_10990 [Fimbriimonas sp.]
MRAIQKTLIGVGLAAALVVAGCTGATDVSKQPSQDEIQAGIQRRLDAIDKDPNMTPQAKEMAKARIQGQAPQSALEKSAREKGASGN